MFMNLPCFECPFGELGFQVDLSGHAGPCRAVKVSPYCCPTPPQTPESCRAGPKLGSEQRPVVASYDWDGGTTGRRLVSCNFRFNMLCVHRSLMIFVFRKWFRMISWIPGCCAGFIVERWWEMLELRKFDLPYVAICRVMSPTTQRI